MGALKEVSGLALTIPIIRELVLWAAIDPGFVEDVIWGCNYQKTYLEKR
jgi:acetyl-CoA C-acetyltransferase